MKFQKILVSCLCLFTLSSIGLTNTPKIHAQDYMRYNENMAKRSRTVYLRKPISVERMTGSVFATMHRLYWEKLYKGCPVKVNQFIHMGRDGYVLNLPNPYGLYSNRSTSYIMYYPSNSRNWWQYSHYGRKYVKSHFKTTNNHHTLDSESYYYSEKPINKREDIWTEHVHTTYNPNDKHAYITKNWIFDKDENILWTNELTTTTYKYIGHKTWKKIN